MLKRLILGSAAAAAALAAAAPAGAAAAPTAQASGTDAPPPLPSLVQTRLTRLDKALERLTDDVNEVDARPCGEGRQGRAPPARRRMARRQLLHRPRAGAAGRGRAGAPRRRGVRLRDLAPKVRAKIAQDDEGPVIADPVTTAMAVFDSFHAVSSTVIELTDGAHVPMLDAMSRTLFLALDRRDKAIDDVHTLAPPAPPEDLAQAAQEEEAATFDVTMPGLPLWLDDEIQHVDGLVADAPDLTAGGKRVLNKARAQIVLTEAKINGYWPPVIDD